MSHYAPFVILILIIIVALAFNYYRLSNALNSTYDTLTYEDESSTATACGGAVNVGSLRDPMRLRSATQVGLAPNANSYILSQQQQASSEIILDRRTRSGRIEGFGFGFGFKFSSFMDIFNQRKKQMYSLFVPYTPPPPPPPTPCKDAIIGEFVAKIPQGDAQITGTYNDSLLGVLYWFLNTDTLRRNWQSSKELGCGPINSFLAPLTDASKYNVKNFSELQQLKTVLQTIYPNSENNLSVNLDLAYRAMNGMNVPFEYIYDKKSQDGLGRLTKMAKIYGMMQVNIGNKTTQFLPSTPPLINTDGSQSSNPSLLELLRRNLSGIQANDITSYIDTMYLYYANSGAGTIDEKTFGQVYFNELAPLLENRLIYQPLNQIQENLYHITYDCSFIEQDSFPAMLRKHVSYMDCWKIPNLPIYVQFTNFIQTTAGIDYDFCGTRTRFIKYMMDKAFVNGETQAEWLSKPSKDSDVSYWHYWVFIYLLKSVNYKFTKQDQMNKWLDDLNNLGYSINNLLSDAKIGATQTTFYKMPDELKKLKPDGFSTLFHDDESTLRESGGIVGYLKRNIRKLFGFEESFTDESNAYSGDDIATLNAFLGPDNQGKWSSHYHKTVEQLFAFRGLQNYADAANNKNLWPNMTYLMNKMNECGIHATDFVTLKQNDASSNIFKQKCVKVSNPDAYYYVTKANVLRKVDDTPSANLTIDIGNSITESVNSKTLGDPVSVKTESNYVTLYMGIPIQESVDGIRGNKLSADPFATYNTSESPSVIGSNFCVLMDAFLQKQSTATDWISVLDTISKYGISDYQNLNEFLTRLSNFKVYYGKNYNKFTAKMNDFKMDKDHKANYNRFIDDIQFLGHNYTDNADKVDAIIDYFIKSGYDLTKYDNKSLPNLLITNLKSYDHDKSKYKNNLLDIQNKAYIDLLPTESRQELIENAFKDVIMVVSGSNTMEISGTNVNAFIKPNLTNILSFIYSSEYKQIKAKTYSDDPTKIVKLMQDIGNAMIKYSTKDERLFKRLAYAVTLFPATCFEYIVYAINGEDTYDVYMQENQTTYAAPQYRSVNTV